ncbi:MAG: arabinan endo-1,5-alpha-L-arabinosidase [Lachnospiraceae bacterium]
MYENLSFPREPKHPAGRPVLEPGKHPDLTPDSLWFTHDPAIYHDPVSGNYYVYGTGADALRSKDLISWERMGKVIEGVPDEAFAHVGTQNIWAPDIVKVGNEYRLYCSNSSFGVQQSCIFLAVADNAEGPFVPRGIVVKTDNTCIVNAIDANIIEDNETGQQYMVYGSFWDGIRILKLNKETGLAGEEGLGECIAHRPLWCDGAIEGPYIIYNPDTEYYYLFVSYGSLNSDYNIRVGRSKSVTGPYLDHNNRAMTDLDDFDNTVGYMIACGYGFHEGQQYMGPGHNSVLRDFDNEWYLVHHIRPKEFKRGDISTMHVRKILWSEDGWPLASPEVYSGEKLQPLKEEDIVGKYERIRLTPTVPQGVQTSITMELRPDFTASMGISIHAQWKMVDEYTIALTYANTTETYKVIPCWDYELWKPTLAITGKDDKGICLWGKKYE